MVEYPETHLPNLAGRLRRLRQIRGLSLTEVAGAADVTKGYLSKIETGRATPSIAVLSRLAYVYQMPLSDLIVEDSGAGVFSLVRKHERRRIDRGGRELGYVYEAISFRKANRIAEAFFLTLPALKQEDPRPTFRHRGEEVFICLEGQVRFYYGDVEHILNEGDCAQFDPEVAHRGEAFGGQNARALVIILPPIDAITAAATHSAPEETPGDSTPPYPEQHDNDDEGN